MVQTNRKLIASTIASQTFAIQLQNTNFHNLFFLFIDSASFFCSLCYVALHAIFPAFITKVPFLIGIVN